MNRDGQQAKRLYDSSPLQYYVSKYMASNKDEVQVIIVVYEVQTVVY
jgi:hypothetical protein